MNQSKQIYIAPCVASESEVREENVQRWTISTAKTSYVMLHLYFQNCVLRDESTTTFALPGEPFAPSFCPTQLSPSQLRWAGLGEWVSSFQRCCKYQSHKYKYKYKYLTLKYKYKYKYKYFKMVLEYYSSTSTSTKYYISGSFFTAHQHIKGHSVPWVGQMDGLRGDRKFRRAERYSKVWDASHNVLFLSLSVQTHPYPCTPSFRTTSVVSSHCCLLSLRLAAAPYVLRNDCVDHFSGIFKAQTPLLRFVVNLSQFVVDLLYNNSCKQAWRREPTDVSSRLFCWSQVRRRRPSTLSDLWSTQVDSLSDLYWHLTVKWPIIIICLYNTIYLQHGEIYGQRRWWPWCFIYLLYCDIRCNFAKFVILYDELSECCTKQKLSVCEFAYLCPTGMDGFSAHKCARCQFYDFRQFGRHCKINNLQHNIMT